MLTKNINVKERKGAPQEKASQVPQQFTRRIGSSYYKVAVHFSDTSKENITDKINRLIRNEIINSKAVEQ